MSELDLGHSSQVYFGEGQKSQVCLNFPKKAFFVLKKPWEKLNMFYICPVDFPFLYEINTNLNNL